MENQKKTLSLPTEFITAVKQYQKDNYLTSFSGAVVFLVMKSLEKEAGK